MSSEFDGDYITVYLQDNDVNVSLYGDVGMLFTETSNLPYGHPYRVVIKFDDLEKVKKAINILKHVEKAIGKSGE